MWRHNRGAQVESSMDTADTARRLWTADAFLRTDQYEFGLAWRHEGVDGRIVAHAAPSPDQAAIAANLTTAFSNRPQRGTEYAMTRNMLARLRR
jgi:hypothetical protein